MTPSVELDISGRVARVVLSRDERRNSFDTRMLEEMEQAVQALERAREVEVVVLSARGKAFCGGTDLKELALLDADATLHWQRRTGQLVERWTRLEATTLTAFQGAAIGSGAIVGLASDLRIATHEAWCQFPEVGYGIPLTWSGVQLLVGLIGMDRTRRALLLQERFDAQAMHELGLVMELMDASRLDVAIERYLKLLLDAPMLGRAMTKSQVRAAHASPGFSAGTFDPYLASLSIHMRGPRGYLDPGKP